MADLLGSSRAIAGIDDVNTRPAIAETRGVVAVARQLIDDVVESERAVVRVLKDAVVSRTMKSSWRLDAGAPFLARATGIFERSISTVTPYGGPAQPAVDIGDLPLGARWRVLRGDADLHVPSVSWMPEVPAANPAPTALRPTLHLSGEWALPNDFSLGVMPGMAVDLGPQGRRQASGTLSVTLGKTWTPQWRTFVDMARDRLATAQFAGSSTTLDAGLTFVASSTTKIDFAVTHGLTDSAPPLQAGVGVSSSF
jgi:hypothetical protein